MRTLVTNAEIEEVGESLIQRYICNKKPSPKCIDIEGFIKDFLHLPLVYEALAEDDKDKIGFVSDGNYPLNVHRNQKRERIIYPKGTVVLDRYLLHEDWSGQRRFTLAHEAAHVVFERMSPTAAGPYFNRLYDGEKAYSIGELRAHLNLCEAQTDRMAAVLLMPKFLARQTMQAFCNGERLPVYGHHVMRRADKLSVQKMADSMGVTFTALLIRLRSLGLIEYRQISEYLETEMSF